MLAALNNLLNNELYFTQSEHESMCLFRLVKCPNSDSCLSLKAKVTLIL